MKFQKLRCSLKKQIADDYVSDRDPLGPRFKDAQDLNDRVHYCFSSICFKIGLVIYLLSTLTFAITFEPLELDNLYLACIRHK